MVTLKQSCQIIDANNEDEFRIDTHEAYHKPNDEYVLYTYLITVDSCSHSTTATVNSNILVTIRILLNTTNIHQYINSSHIHVSEQTVTHPHQTTRCLFTHGK